MMIQKHIGYTSWNDNFRADHLPEMPTVAANTQPKNIFCDTQRRGYIAIEAEHYATAVAPAGTAWTVYPDMGRTKSAVALTPYTQETGNAHLDYHFQAPEGLTKLQVRVVVKSTLDFLNRGGHEYDVSVDGGEPVRVNFNARLNEDPKNVYSVFYPTVASRVVENRMTLTLPAEAEVHTLTLHPCTPGIVFEKVVIDFGGYQKQYLFGQESERK